MTQPNELFEPIPDNADTEHLFHYTTAEGLLGIVRSLSVWASEIRALNDDQEFFYGVEIVRNEILALARSDADSPAGTRARWLNDQFQRMGEYVRIPVFVASFSAAPDLLSQWRGYCPSGGYAIGFRTDYLREQARSRGFILDPCIYDATEQRERLAKVVVTVVGEWVRAGPPVPSEGEHEGLVVGRRLERELAYVLPFIKHPSFREEKEWRLVLPLPRDERHQKKHRVMFRNRANHVVPYVELELPPDRNFWTASRIVIGPSLRQEQQKKYLVLLMEQEREAQSGSRIHRSASPYRPA